MVFIGGFATPIGVLLGGASPPMEELVGILKNPEEWPKATT